MNTRTVRGPGLVMTGLPVLLSRKDGQCFTDVFSLLWPPCIADADIIFAAVVSFLFFFPRLFSAVGDWMSTILLHMMWP